MDNEVQDDEVYGEFEGWWNNLMSLETELRDRLICLAECRVDLSTWQEWWTAHAVEVKKIISPGDFSRLNCADSLCGPSTFMLKCQEGAERYLRKMEISFQHADIYKKESDEEYRRYHERLTQKRMAEQMERQEQYKQRQRNVQELLADKFAMNELRQLGIRTLPLGAKDAEIIKLLIEWTEFLANGEYTEAFEMFLSYNDEIEWTPEMLESAVYGYGCPGLTKEEAEKQFGSSDYRVTSLWNNPDRDRILCNIVIDYDELTEDQAKVRGLTDMDYENILGDIHYEGVPLNGEESDLTARFFIKKIAAETISLCFCDLHVM